MTFAAGRVLWGFINKEGHSNCKTCCISTNKNLNCGHYIYKEANPTGGKRYSEWLHWWSCTADRRFSNSRDKLYLQPWFYKRGEAQRDEKDQAGSCECPSVTHCSQILLQNVSVLKILERKLLWQLLLPLSRWARAASEQLENNESKWVNAPTQLRCVFPASQRLSLVISWCKLPEHPALLHINSLEGVWHWIWDWSAQHKSGWDKEKREGQEGK